MSVDYNVQSRLHKLEHIYNLDIESSVKRKLINDAINDIYADIERQMNDQKLAATLAAIEPKRVVKFKKVSRKSAFCDYFHVPAAFGEMSASTTRTLLVLFHQAGVLSEVMPIFAAVLVLSSTIITLSSVEPKNLETHKLINTIATVITGLLTTASYVATVVFDEVSAISSYASYMPFVGVFANALLLLTEIAIAIDVEVRCKKDIELLTNKAESILTDHDNSWILDGKKLSKEQQKFKKALLRVVDISKIKKDDKDDFIRMFDKDNYGKTQDQLIKHIQSERIKRLNRHFINIAVLLVLLSAGTASLFVPGAGLVLGLSVTGFLFAAISAKLVLFNTVLKETKLKVIHQEQDLKESKKEPSYCLKRSFISSGTQKVTFDACTQTEPLPLH